jgi:eukaryotic-like serine/threonine-protein kinase
VTSQDPSDDGEQQLGESPDSFDLLLRSVARTPQVLRQGASLADRRFQIVRALGQGGMGVVYEALDATRAGRVALKTLTRCGPQDLYRLKNEFRSLSDVAHPNLVALHEFICDDDVWFFTMDLLEGEDFLAYVRGGEVPELAQTKVASEPEFDEPRLRDALSQLVQGVVALHQAGKLHCDLKPGNVMVGKTGHLTILDFGLVSERVGPSTGRTLGNEFAGTPGYMAPEQMDARDLSPEADYYAIGVMLYEAMTGRLPFRSAHGLAARSPERAVATLPPRLLGGASRDLAELCLELLAFEPSARPSEASLIARACRASARGPRASVPKIAQSASFVGREAELARLLALRSELASSTPQAVLIRGPSGIGKTRLVQEFLRTCHEQRDAIVLEGRCYERESLPYNAFDSLIDALSRYLRRLTDVRAATLMPRDARVLAELFPVLRRVASIDAMPSPSRAPSDPLQLRRRAFEALKELLSRISDLSPLVLCVDDMQWADADSLQLLEAILSEPAPPRMLLVGLYLADHEAALSAVTRLCAQKEVRLTEIALEPLSEAAALSLIAEKLELAEAEAVRMARESNGNPFFLSELIAAGTHVESASTDLRQVILARAALLSPGMRGLLDLLCVAGAPLDFGTALSAAGLAGQGQGLVTELRNERWLRLDPGGKSQRVEIYHDRIRSVLLEALDPTERTQIRQRLAECLEARPGADEEIVASYWLEAGAPERAAGGFARAASRADKNLAFVSAGRLYALALEHGRFEPGERQRLRFCLAAALERAGYAVAAARAYLDAARAYDADASAREAGGDASSEALTLRRKAAQLLLASGSLEAGIEVLRGVLAEVGLDYPEQPEQAMHGLELARQELSARGLETDIDRLGQLPVAPHPGSELVRRRADACWAAGPTLGSYDFVRAGYFATRGLALALDTGDALRIARALAMYATSLASGGNTDLACKLAERALALAVRLDDPIARANAELVLGQVSLFAGDFASCLASADRALAMFRSSKAGESLEIHLCNMFANMALHMSGRLPELIERSREQLVNAKDRGHIHAEASLRVFGVALDHLANDEPALARSQGEISARLWSQDQFHGERLKVLRLEVWCDLYEGDGARAFARFAEARDQAQASLLLSSRYWRFWWFDLAASSALSAASGLAEGPLRATLLAEAEQAIAMLATMPPEYVRAQLLVYRAAHAHLKGDARAALDGLRALCGVSHGPLAACAQVKLGRLLGGPEGLALRDLGLHALGPWLKSKERWTDFMLPGFGAHAR